MKCAHLNLQWLARISDENQDVPRCVACTEVTVGDILYEMPLCRRRNLTPSALTSS